MKLLSVSDLCALPDDTLLVSIAGMKETAGVVLGMPLRGLYKDRPPGPTRWAISRQEIAFR